MCSSIITLGKSLLILGIGSKCINEYMIHKYSHRTQSIGLIKNA